MEPSEQVSAETPRASNPSQEAAAASADTMMPEAYEEKMLEAFVQKPEKVEWYRQAFSKFDVNGVERMAWVWSWWAFFGGFWFLLYRKAYMPALALFIVEVIASFIPFLGLIVAILAGGFSTYFVYKTYKNKKMEIESKIDDPIQRIETMRAVGGYHQWVVWVAVILGILWILAIIASITASQTLQQ